ncbi:MAG: hypothetical protein KDB00_27085, partial [Planctomycetales bacterium]|nr:hypothetical protein [Planctomycetales bacterium]
MNKMQEQWNVTVRGLLEGDQAICLQFWNSYGERLRRIAGRRLPEKLRRRIEPEDIVQSACRSFFRRVQSRKLELTDHDMLWPLLCAITINKVRQQIRFHCRQRRDPRREEANQGDAENTPAPDEFSSSQD